MSTILEISGLHAGYGRIEVLHGIDLRVERGTVVAMLGPNGAGKTTTVRSISGLVAPFHGRITMCGVDVTGVAADRLARAGVCVIPEGRGIFPRLTVEEHLRLTTWGKGTKEARERVFDAFPSLHKRRQQIAGTMSGGEQQMLSLSRAVAVQPSLLVIDELSMGLAPLIVGQLYEYVRQIAAQGVSILLVEQFVHDVLGIADAAVVVQHGLIVRSGRPEELAGDLAELYLASEATSARSR